MSSAFFTQIKTPKTLSISDIGEISIPSLMTYEDIIAMVPNVPIEIEDSFWLRNTSENEIFTHALTVQENGSIKDWPKRSLNGIRPLIYLHWSVPKMPFDPGTKIMLDKVPCTLVHPRYLFADKVITHYLFDKNSKYYKQSELKQFIESGEFKTLFTKETI